MAALIFTGMVISSALLMSSLMWLVSKKTRVEGKFLEWYLLSLVASLTVFAPLIGFYILLPLLFLLLWKWQGIRFWPEIRFWPDSLIILFVGWGANYLFLLMLRFLILRGR